MKKLGKTLFKIGIIIFVVTLSIQWSFEVYKLFCEEGEYFMKAMVVGTSLIIPGFIIWIILPEINE